MRSPVAQEVSDELKRVVERWRQLPFDHALSRMPLTLALVQTLADRVAGWRGGPSRSVPDLGPAVVMDQLTAMVFEACAADPARDAQPGPAPDAAELVGELSAIRRAL
jgi:hypothetical protein